jgi:hypothetical protein
LFRSVVQVKVKIKVRVSGGARGPSLANKCRVSSVTAGAMGIGSAAYTASSVCVGIYGRGAEKTLGGNEIDPLRFESVEGRWVVNTMRGDVQNHVIYFWISESIHFGLHSYLQKELLL